MASYKVHYGQSLIDIALQVYGSAEAVVQLALDNNRTLTDELPAGTLLTYDETVGTDNELVSYLRVRRQPVVTFTREQQGEVQLLEHTIEEHTSAEHN